MIHVHHLAAAVFCCLATGALPGQQRAIAGMVHGADGIEAASAVVLLRWRVHPELPGLVGHSLGDAGIESLRTVADAKGRLQLRPPHPGPFELTACAADGKACSAPAFPVMAGDFVDLQLAAPVSVGGVGRDAAGRPLVRTTVTLRPHYTSWTRLAGYRVPEARGRCTTDDTGRFALPLSCGYLRAPRWEPFVVPDFGVAGQWPKQDVLLRATRACSELELTLVAAAGERGIVLAADGKPLAGAQVLDSTAPQRSAITAADGSFAVPARFCRDVVVLAAGCAVATLPPGAAPGAAHPAGGAAATVRLQRGAVLRARLLDDRDRPLAGAAVLWSIPLAGGLPLEFAATTDAAGNCSFDRGGNGFAVLGFVAVAGVYRPFARLLPTADVDLGAVRIGAPRQLRGQVLASDGTPVPHARLAALPREPLPDEAALITYSDHGGSFAFTGLPAGRLDVFADAAMLGLARVEVEADATTATVELSPQGVVEGVVHDAEGAPVAGAWVTLTRNGGVDEGAIPGPSPRLTSVAGHSDADGRFRFVGLPAGAWTVLGNRLRDGVLSGGSCAAETDGAAVTLTLRQQPG